MHTECGAVAFSDYADGLVEHADGSYSDIGVLVDLSGLVPGGGANGFRVGGVFHVECWTADGQLRWEDDLHNGVTNVALDHILNVVLAGTVSAIATWYIGLIDNAGFTATAAADTMASHAGWSELSALSVSNATRPVWSIAGSSGQTVTNATPASFSILLTKTVRGLFLASANDIAGTTGTLFSTAMFTGGNQAVANGDTLKVTYTVQSANAAGNS